jgi:hypothetical protein
MIVQQSIAELPAGVCSGRCEKEDTDRKTQEARGARGTKGQEARGKMKQTSAKEAK